MKKAIFAALCIAAFFFTAISCKWFQPGNKHFSIVGKWKIDSIYNTGDMDIRVQNAMTGWVGVHDSIVFEFSADSILATLPGNSSRIKKYYLQDSVLFVKEDSAFVPLPLHILNDSLVSITQKDSIVVVLKKT